MKKNAFLAMFLMPFAISCLAQTNTGGTSSDNSNDVNPINYSFDSKDKNYHKFDQTFPFDKVFTLHFTGIPDSVNYIDVSIMTVDAQKYRHLPKGDTVDENTIKDVRSTYILKRWERNGNANISTGDIIETLPLLPNTDYIVGVRIGTFRKLTKDESYGLSAALTGDKNIISAVKLLGDTAKTQNRKPDEINRERKNLIKLFGIAVQTYNANYRVKPPNNLEQLHKTQGFGQPIKEAKKQINNILIKRKDNPPAEIQALSKQIDGLDWGTVKQTSIDSIGKALDNAVIADQKAHDDAVKEKKDTVPFQNPGFLKHDADLVKVNLNAAIKARDIMLHQLVDSVVVRNTYVQEGQSPTYRTDFVKNAKLYYTLDLGYAYVGRIDRWLAYTGFNFYFRPVDKGIPLSYYKQFWDFMSVRTSLLIGLSIGSVAEDNVRKGLIGNQALVLGAGFRVLPFLKLNGGTFVHYRYDPNPLFTSNRYYSSFSPFVSFSLDIDVKTLFSGIGDSIFK